MYKIGFATLATFALLFAAPLARADVVSAHPVVWHVKSPQGGNVTLFGSLHVLPANMDWLTPDIMHAVSRADVFVFEVPTDASSQETLNSLIAAHGELPPGQSLRALLPPDAQSSYDAVIAAAHLSPSLTDREQPWLVSLQLTLADTMNRNYFPDAGVDYVLMSWANAHARSVRYLETIDQQFALLTPSDSDLSLEDFETGLKNMEGAPDTIQPLVQAWSDGDVAKLGSLMDANFADHPEAKKRLLTDRNQQWASQIERMLTDKRSYFVTVGAAHLAGADGVPAILRKDGFQVDGP
jgi:uncharacterized protein YbaP (TraB family)